MNQSGGTRTEVNEETVEILQFALDMAEQTNGSLDPTISPVVTAWGFVSRDVFWYYEEVKNQPRSNLTEGRTWRLSKI